MRRFFALVLVFAGFTVAAAPAAAQSAITALPSGVTLRINGPASHLEGLLYQQSVDSVWLRASGRNAEPRGIAVSQITSVDRAQPQYVKSILIGTGVGALVAAALYNVTVKGDRDIAVGFSIIGGAVAGMLFPHIDWVPVPLH